MPQAPRLCPAVPRSCSVSAPSAQRLGAEAAHDLAREQRADRAVGVAHVALERQLLAARERVAGEREHLAVERRGGRLARDAGEARRRRPRARRPATSSAREVDAGAAVARPGARDRCGRRARRSARTPSCAISSRTSSATNRRYWTTCSGVPAKRRRSSGSCVAMPTGQVLRWQTRIMMQPAATSGAVEKPNSSAPSSAPMMTSRPVRRPPSTCSRTRPRRSLPTSTCCVSARPSSQGTPACRIDDVGEAPGAAVHAGDHDVVGAGLGDAGGDGADAGERDELDADLGASG